ncbi:MAG: MDR family MFS transporter [Candidatus Dormibacteraceae bacterium]
MGGATGAARAYVRSLRPDLPRAMWVVVGAQLLSAIGTGFVLPFGTIYLHFVRGIPIPVVGTVISTISLGGLVVNFAGGGLIDRFGARRVVLGGVGFQAAGFLVFAFAAEVPVAFAAALLAGIGNGLFFPAMATVIANLTTSRQRSGAASLQYVAINIGIGLGSVIGGFVVSVQHPSTFVAVYLANAVSFAVFGLLIAAWVPELRTGPAQTAAGGPPRAPDRQPRSGYRAVLRDRAFLGLVGFNSVVVMTGYAQLDSAMPLYAKTYLGVQPSALGLILAANTAFIVVLQLPITRAVRHLRRTRVLAAFAGTWAVAWLIGFGASAMTGLAAAVGLGVTAVVFGIGECLLTSTMAPLSMDLAPETARGTYMASVSLSWSVGLLVGPALGGVVVGSALHQAFWPLLALSAVGLVGWALALEARIPGGANRPAAPANP